MKSITIHDMEPKLYELIKEKAKQQRLSLNKTIKKLLAKSLGIKNAQGEPHCNDFIEFLGIWTKDDTREFNAAVEDFGKVDPGDTER